MKNSRIDSQEDLFSALARSRIVFKPLHRKPEAVSPKPGL